MWKHLYPFKPQANTSIDVLVKNDCLSTFFVGISSPNMWTAENSLEYGFQDIFDGSSIIYCPSLFFIQTSLLVVLLETSWAKSDWADVTNVLCCFPFVVDVFAPYTVTVVRLQLWKMLPIKGFLWANWMESSPLFRRSTSDWFQACTIQSLSLLESTENLGAIEKWKKRKKQKYVYGRIGVWKDNKTK